MWKWVIGIVMICIACVVADEIREAIRPKRPDEEIILEAIFQSRHAADAHEYSNPDEIDVSDKWVESGGTFQQNINETISDVEHSLKMGRIFVSDPRLSAEDQALFRYDVTNDERNLGLLRQVLGRLPKDAKDSQIPIRPIKTLQLPPPFVFLKEGAIGGAGSILPTSSYTFDSPIFSADRDYVFVKYEHDSVAFLHYWAVLARTRHGWRLIAMDAF